MVHQMTLKKKRDLLGIISFGLFLILVGVIFAITPDLNNAARDFIKDFELKKADGNLFLPAPAHPPRHNVVYTAVGQFCLVWSIFQIGILFSRFFLRDTIHKKAETFSGIIFWLGAAYIINLLRAESISWFAFLAEILMLIGLVIIARSLVELLYHFLR